jgi:hypothetical protein
MATYKVYRLARGSSNLLVIAKPVFQALKTLDKEKENEKKITTFKSGHRNRCVILHDMSMLASHNPCFNMKKTLFCCDHNILLFFPRPVGTDFLCNPDFFWLSVAPSCSSSGAVDRS